MECQGTVRTAATITGRGCCTYCTRFAAPVYDPAQQQVWLQFEGVNASAAVLLNGQQLCTHDGGYSTFRVEVTELLQAENQLTVRVDNSVNDRVLPPESRLHLLRRHLPGCEPAGGEQKTTSHWDTLAIPA